MPRIPSDYKRNENSYLNLQRKRLSKAILISIIVAGIATGLVNLLFFDNAQAAAAVLFGMALTGLVGLQLHRLGKRWVAKTLVLGAAILALNFNLIDGNGINDPGAIALPLIVIIGGVFYGKESILPLTIIALLSIVTVSFLELAGHVQSDYPSDLDDAIVIVLIVILGGFVFWYWISAYEKNTEALHTTLRELNDQRDEINRNLREKEILLKEIHHRVKNNMQIMESLLSLQSGRSSTEADRTALEESRYMINAMAQIHDQLYTSETLDRINIRGLWKRLITGYSGDVLERAGQIHFEDTSEDVYVSINQAIPFTLIMNELILNALKHGFHAAAEPRIRIYTVERKGCILLEVQDNGPGFPGKFFTDSVRTEGLGMELVHTLVAQLRGNIKFENRKGAYVQVEFPCD